jgi:hypothetical protein
MIAASKELPRFKSPWVMGVLVSLGVHAVLRALRLLVPKITAIPLQSAVAAVIDTTNKHMAFRVDFEGKLRWIAFGLKERFPDAHEAVRAIMASRCTEGKIPRSSF